jgi:hypothetical protein
MSQIFKMDFDINDYTHLFPEMPKDNSLILNSDIQEIDGHVWKKLSPPKNKAGQTVITQEFLLQESIRFKEGVFILIKGVPMWIPPDYYFFLQYWNAQGKPPEFRLKQLKSAYVEEKILQDKRYFGQIKFKNRKDGETLYRMSKAFFSPIRAGLSHCNVHVQSKDAKTVKDTCWKFMKSGLNGMPKYFKDYFMPDLVNEQQIQTEIRIERIQNDEDENDYGKLIVYNYGPCVANYFDGSSDVIDYCADEFAKMEEDSAYDMYGCCKTFISPGLEDRMGLMHFFSSPSEKNGFSNDNALRLWNMSKIDPATGTNQSRLMPVYSNPLDGIEKHYDKFGDIIIEREQIKKKIETLINSADKDKRLQMIRHYPLPIEGTNELDPEKVFGSTDDKAVCFINIQGIKNQHNKLIESNNEVVYGNLNWPDNVPFSGIPIFKQHDTNDFDEIYAKFCFSFTKFVHPNAGGDIKKAPPSYLVENVIGFDPINREMGSTNKKVKNRLSEPAAVCWRFRDTAGYGIEKEIIGSYLGPVGDQRVSQMDMLKFMLFTNSMLQIEKADGNSMMQCAYDNGMIDWMIDGRTDDFVEVVDKNDNQLRKIKVKGDMPSGRGSSEFIGEIIELINGITAPEYNESATPDFDPASKIKHRGVTGSLTVFDPSNTEKAHFTMALGQALIGAGKLMYGKKKMKSGLNNEMLRGLLD